MTHFFRDGNVRDAKDGLVHHGGGVNLRSSSVRKSRGYAKHNNLRKDDVKLKHYVWIICTKLSSVNISRFRQLLARYEGLVKFHGSMHPFRLFVIEQNKLITI